MELFSLEVDSVVDGHVVSGATTYNYALRHFVPLIEGLDIQRDALKTRFYDRLEKDIVRGCVMPPITIAFVEEMNLTVGEDEVFRFIKANISKGFVLDGIQRLNTLKRAAAHNGFDGRRKLFFNAVITASRDRLLYRMITLNNGQKAMSARHQIDVLADAFFDMEAVQLKLIPEKGGQRVRDGDEFKKADFIKGYIAYLSGSVNIDNQKIIDEKMDELVASRIIESDITITKVEFNDVVEIIFRISSSEALRPWIKLQNNFIGFCVGAKTSVKALKKARLAEIETAVETFERAFKGINVVKVNLGKARREAVSKFIEGFDKLKNLDEFDLLDKISTWVS